tara:strand:- start:54 stop:533 length:480 start_codon:yes stop_codon:yes gene_type:complete
MIRNCPDCGALLKEKHISDNKCWKCGSTSILDAIEKEKKEDERIEAENKEKDKIVEKKVEDKRIEEDDNQVKDYPAIRFLSQVSTFSAWAGIFIGIIGYLIWMDSVSRYTDESTKVLMFFAFALGTFIFFIYWKAISELLIILVDIARDLRKLRLNKDS